MSLFESGFFTLHSGETSSFKIDCDALTDTDITSIASQLKERIPSFYQVIGIPRGGLRLAHALRPYCIANATYGLVVDDVFTTGSSMEETRQAVNFKCWGAVIFARRPTPYWITPLFLMSYGT